MSLKVADNHFLALTGQRNNSSQATLFQMTLHSTYILCTDVRYFLQFCPDTLTSKVWHTFGHPLYSPLPALTMSCFIRRPLFLSLCLHIS